MFSYRASELFPVMVVEIGGQSRKIRHYFDSIFLGNATRIDATRFVLMLLVHVLMFCPTSYQRSDALGRRACRRPYA